MAAFPNDHATRSLSKAIISFLRARDLWLIRVFSNYRFINRATKNLPARERLFLTARVFSIDHTHVTRSRGHLKMMVLLKL